MVSASEPENRKCITVPNVSFCVIHFTEGYVSTGMEADIPENFSISASSVSFSSAAVNSDRLQLGPIEFSGSVSILKCIVCIMWSPHTRACVYVQNKQVKLQQLLQGTVGICTYVLLQCLEWLKQIVLGAAIQLSHLKLD